MGNFTLKNLLFILLLSIPAKGLSGEGNRHLVSVTSAGLGWTSAYESVKPEGKSPFDAVSSLLHNVGLNYAYRFTDRIHVGVFAQSSRSTLRVKNRDSSASTSERNSLAYGVFGLYSFHEKIGDAWYAGAGLSLFNQEEEIAGDLEEAEGKGAFELDDRGVTFEVLIGKRFSLERWGIEDISYAPNVGGFVRKHGKDFSDQGIERGRGLTVVPVKFDLIF